MLFNTFIYPFFLALAVLIFWVLPKKMRLFALVSFSIVFYAFSEIKFLVLILLLSIFTYFIGKQIKKKELKKDKKKYLILGMLFIILALVWFKYSNLLINTLEDIAGGDWNISRVLLPLGISFFTFEFHYLIEMYYNRLPDHSALEFFSFALFFPTLASGPIKRFPKFFDSIKQNTIFSQRYFFTGIFLILLGYSQKYFIADNLVERTAFLSAPNLVPSGMAAISGIFFYSVRIFFDFAGLSNVAIGSALLFGVEVPINFNYPYFRKDLASFWRYWHMSLTSWVRDYVYMPLVFRFRNSKTIIFVTVIFTMALIGLWHGSSWNFLFFGLYHGIGLALLQIKILPKTLNILPNWLKYGLGMALTFVFVSFGWPLFVTSSLHDSVLLYQKIFAIFI